MHIINTQVQQVSSISNPEYNPDFPVHTANWLDSLCCYRVGQGGADIYSILILEAPLLSIWGLATKNPESPPTFMHKGSTTQATFHPRSCIVVYQQFKETLEK